MSAGKTEDFLCIQDISVFLVLYRGFIVSCFYGFLWLFGPIGLELVSSKSFETTGWRVQ